LNGGKGSDGSGEVGVWSVTLIVSSEEGKVGRGDFTVRKAPYPKLDWGVRVEEVKMQLIV